MGIMTWLEDFTKATDVNQALRNKQALDAQNVLQKAKIRASCC